MEIKKRTIVRVLFIIMFTILIATIVLKYSSFERRILLFEMFRGIVSLYGLIVELPLAFVRNRNQLDKLWKRVVLLPVLIFAVFSICVAGINTYNLTKDVFTGYLVKVVSIIEREHEYRSSDRIWVSDNSKRLKLYLAPGYVNVDVGKAYTFRVFENSHIAISINKVEQPNDDS
ncbi:hypothetical protein NST04_23325 [Paenibacillus sp. FSL H7-0756]|uniref:hypothetical protein n=1 Tax=Paenibacillus sp. FSL H7-0756 TaxID=2954738 RepID=UPI0030F77739